MLGFLFRRLTAAPAGEILFDSVTARARTAAWYVDGQVPDTLDGRFAVLATLLALALVRLDQLGDGGIRLGIALTERFVTVMELEHRELGLGDPTLGKTVRKLVGGLSRRVGLWRDSVDGTRAWQESAEQSLYRAAPLPAAIAEAAESLRAFWTALEGADLNSLAEGKIG